MRLIANLVKIKFHIYTQSHFYEFRHLVNKNIF